MPGEDWPDPRAATTDAEFVAALREVRTRADMSFRALERRAAQAGDALPSSTTNSALARDTLPRTEFVAAFIRACGGDDKTVQAWVNARADLASGGAPAVTSDNRRKVAWLVGAIALLIAVATTVLITTSASTDQTITTGAQQIRVAATGMCLGEGPEKFKDTGREVLGQHECASAGPPISIEPAAEGRYQLVLHHPQHGPGCVTIDGGGQYTEVLMAGAPCEAGRPDQEFTFEAVTSPVEGYRLRSVSGAKWCVGVYQNSGEPGVQLIQNPCDNGPHQVFQLRPPG
ncbi:RICIN domain-containing protein [Kibdelosporangium persicum]|uniref:Ricin B lectin domain-containing protein n=1 Tax=Kibdelosporangium persicum TaxID=2698649 RepID=A0ABX2F8L5_9PSEU|nr:RICIN domain-containing protein [Kibdelosporangium persicum]NRN67684.1 hypothetical protein [Kibdelosporangium persicum]